MITNNSASIVALNKTKTKSKKKKMISPPPIKRHLIRKMERFSHDKTLRYSQYKKCLHLAVFHLKFLCFQIVIQRHCYSIQLIFEVKQSKSISIEQLFGYGLKTLTNRTDSVTDKIMIADINWTKCCGFIEWLAKLKKKKNQR